LFGSHEVAGRRTRPCAIVGGVVAHCIKVRALTTRGSVCLLPMLRCGMFWVCTCVDAESIQPSRLCPVN
jgi:hypothetical protein